MSAEVPEGWRESILEQLAAINPETLPASTKPGQPLRYIDIAAVFGPSALMEPKSLTFGEAPSRARRIARRNDILISTVRPYLRSFCKIDDDDENLVASTGFAIVRAKPNVDPDFLYQHVLSPNFVDHLIPRMRGSNYPAVSAKDVGDYSLPLPPLPEQRHIAEILSSVDEAIAATQAIIDQICKVKQGVLKHLLTKGIGHTRFKQTEIGEIPEEWNIVCTDDICRCISVGIVVQPAQYYVSEGIKCFRSANVREGYIEDKNWAYISPESNELLSKSRLQSGDVLIVRSGYTGTSCVVSPEFDGTNCIDIIFARPMQDRVHPYFLSALINSPIGRKQVLRAEGGLAQKHFNVSAMKKMQIPLPNMDEQHVIAARISDITKQELLSGREVARLKSLKSALMTDLLSGRKRVHLTAKTAE
jgi:type I restriction enzyme S subunit